MTTTYNHSAFPTQQIIYPPAAASQLIGQPLAGARVFTYKSTAHGTAKATYQSNSGSPPPANPNPVVANAIGQVTIYWALDDTDVTNLYYVEIKGPTGDDTLYYSYDNFDGSAIMGSQPQTEKIDMNFVRNPQFTWNRFKTTSNLKNENATAYTGVYVCDDWLFTKSNNSLTENVTLTAFALGQTDVPSSPVSFLKWTVTGGGSGETFKKIFQRYKKVNTYSSNSVILNEMTVQFYAKSTTTSQVSVQMRHYFGSGGSPSADITTPIVTVNLSSTWRLYTASFSVPNLGSTQIGTNNDDAVLLEFNLPLNSVSDFWLANPQLEFGDTANNFQYLTPDQQKLGLEKDWFTAPTGDIKFAAGAVANYPGWLSMNDGTISNVTGAGTTYAHEDAFGLYSYIWTNFANAQCPVSLVGSGASATSTVLAGAVTGVTVTSGGTNYGGSTTVAFSGGGGAGALGTVTVVNGVITAVTVTNPGAGYATPPSVVFTDAGRGNTALIDFDANKTIRLPLVRSRLMGAAGAGSGLSSRANGETGGAETSASVVNHTHSFATIVDNFSAAAGGTDLLGVLTNATGTTGNPNTGGVAAQDIMNPFSFINLFIKL